MQTIQVGQEEEIKQIVSKITDKQQKFEELLNCSEQNILKTIALVQKQFDKVVKKKKKEIRQLLLEHDQKIKEIQKEFQVNQESLSQFLNEAKLNYFIIYEQLYSEEQQFISQFDFDELKHDSSFVMVIYEVLTESTFFSDNQRLNLKLLDDLLLHQDIDKLQEINNQLKQIIQNLLRIEENLTQFSGLEKKKQSSQLLSHSLKKFIQALSIGQRKLDEYYIEISNSHQEIKHQERIIKSNIEFIKSLMKQNQERNLEEEKDLFNSNEKLFILLNKLKEDVEKLKNYQRQNQDNFKTLIDIINFKGEKPKPIEPLMRKNTIKILQSIQQQRTRIFSDSQQQYPNAEQQIKNHKNDNLLESQNLYQSTILEKTPSNQKSPSISDFSQTIKLHSIKNKVSFGQRDLKGLKTGQLVDKKTAIPLKCSCPPQCLCQAQLIIQTHLCNNQLYINSKGEVICKKCSFVQDVWMYNFLCPQNKVKNKFKSDQEFIDSIWNYVKGLTIDEQLVDFWERLQVSCQKGFSNSEILAEDEKMYNFMTRCPKNCFCKSKESYQQYHFCGTQSSITKSGYSYCKKCQIFNMVNHQFIYCEKTGKYNIFCSFDDFLNAVELENENSKKSVFIKFQERQVTQSWD